MQARIMGFLRLMRPANLPTAGADVLAGAAIAGAVSTQIPFSLNTDISDLLFLFFASIALYAGGVVLNDYFDADLDKIERPERAIPSGLVSKKEALIFGSAWLFLGVVLALLVNQTSAIIAIALSFCILLYDAIAKKAAFPGALTMGLCRGLNLLLGISILGELNHWPLAGIPVLYIFAITLISQGEVHGRNKRNLMFAGLIYVSVILIVLYVVNTQESLNGITTGALGIFALAILIPLYKAYRSVEPHHIKKAVIAGVLAIILLDVIFAATFGHFSYAFFVLLLLPISMGLGSLFKVT
ncbi:MAG: UbiA-like protein EboC [Eudoraea sp.]|nr:UbiA-like protein EboC [Eudoraea sp.]